MSKVEGDARLGATASYDCYQLQDEFHAYSPRETYIHLCGRSGCKPIVAVANMFPNTAGTWDVVETVDVSNTYVGAKGATPLIELCKRLSSLKKINLSDNYLNNDTMWYLGYMAMFHPTLREIDVSGNQFITWSGAMCLTEALVRNVRISYLGIRKTGIPPQIAESLFAQTRKNAVAMFVALENTPSPSCHPNAIHLRAMRRFFLEAQEPDGTVPKAKLSEGYREQLRVMGRERDLANIGPIFFDTLEARAPANYVTWEMFVVLVLVEAPTYSPHVEQSLRKAFLQFNMDTSGHEEEGFVEAKSFTEIHQYLFGEVPRASDIQQYLEPLGLGDTNTVNWDEFLYVWYNRSPKEGSKAVGPLLTPLTQSVAPLHH